MNIFLGYQVFEIEENEDFLVYHWVYILYFSN